MKALVAALFVVLLATSAYAIDINSMRAPEGVAVADCDSVMVTATEPQYLPSSFIAFTGSGDEFFVEFWGDWNGDTNYTWSTPPLAVPGAMTLPRVSHSQNRSGTWYTGWRFYCATDSISVIPGDK